MRQIICLALAVLACLPGFGGGTVDIDSCRRMALENNKSLRMSEEGIRGAEYARKAARSAYLPGIDFVMSYFYNQHQTSLLSADAKLPTATFNPVTQGFDLNLVKNPVTGELVLNPANGEPIPSEVAIIPKSAMTYDTRSVAAGAVTLMQPVYMGGQIRAMNEITKYAEELARSIRQAQVQEVVYGVDEAYWLVVSLSAKKRLAESYLALVDSLDRNVTAMLKAGVATRSDALRVQVKLNEANVALTKVSDGLSLSRMALAQICGLPVDSDLRLADENPSVQDVREAPLPPEANMEDVFASRPDLMSLRHGISIFESKEKLALGEMLPKVAIVGAYSFSNPNVIDGFRRRFGGGFSIGATLSVPIWHWGGNYYRYKASKAETNVQRLALEDAKDKVRLQVSQARFKYSEAYKTLGMTSGNLESADENLRCAEVGFREGVLTADDVIAAQTAWLQAYSENIDAGIGVRLCNVYLAKVLGQMKY